MAQREVDVEKMVLHQEEKPMMLRAGAAFFYGVASVLVVFVNKILLTNFRFPSFLCVGIGQMAATIAILWLGRTCRLISFPALDSSVPRKIFPLPLIYVLNLVSGLGGTQMLNLPMFTVLRRFSIFMTMVLEYYILGVRASYGVRMSVGLMILGSAIAAVYDLSFDAWGYTLIFINDIATAAQGVYMKQKLDAKDLGKYGLMYYNCLFMILPAATLASYTGDMQNTIDFMYSDSMTSAVWVALLISCVCGFVLNYSLVLCTHYNSALTTTCVGPIKNLFVTYAGMFSSGDFVFQWANFIGINVSVLGSIVYTYVTFRSKSPQKIITVSPRKNIEKQPLI